MLRCNQKFRIVIFSRRPDPDRSRHCIVCTSCIRMGPWLRTLQTRGVEMRLSPTANHSDLKHMGVEKKKEKARDGEEEKILVTLLGNLCFLDSARIGVLLSMIFVSHFFFPLFFFPSSCVLFLRDVAERGPRDLSNRYMCHFTPPPLPATGTRYYTPDDFSYPWHRSSPSAL